MKDAKRELVPWNDLTLRDWFAGKALTGMLTNDPRNVSDIAAWAAVAAYEMADAMLAAREKSE